MQSKRKQKTTERSKAETARVSSLSQALFDTSSSLKKSDTSKPNFQLMVPSQILKGKKMQFDHNKYKAIDSLLMPIWKLLSKDENKGRILLKNIVIDIYFNVYEIVYFGCFLERLQDYLKDLCNEDNVDMWIAGLAYKVKATLTKYIEDEKVFSACNEDNIYKRGKNLISQQDSQFQKKLTEIKISFADVNAKYWKLFNNINKVIGDENLSSILSKISKKPPNPPYKPEPSPPKEYVSTSILPIMPRQGPSDSMQQSNYSADSLSRSMSIFVDPSRMDLFMEPVRSEFTNYYQSEHPPTLSIPPKSMY